ncbi:MAG: 1-acyl-sn-glycerol-3-phosphate acyltransferase [Candidatus Omnitrophica bacterium]|nr:1-acyl-sn-glycerol-3-phosphate acyltransferase [Candidatus Omnitrophota bacterium]
MPGNARGAGRAAGSVWFYGFIKAVLFIAYKIFFRFRCYGSENIPGPDDPRGVILAANHASFLDPPLIGISSERRVTFLAKNYLFKAFFVGSILRGIGSFPIKTGANDFKTIRGLIRLLEAGRCLLVFPEGTRSPDGQFREPEGGVGFLAAKSRAVVVPVYIRGSFEAFPKGARFFRCHPIEIRFGKAFVPVLEKETAGEGADPYLAVSQSIMEAIKKLAVESSPRE